MRKGRCHQQKSSEQLFDPCSELFAPGVGGWPNKHLSLLERVLFGPRPAEATETSSGAGVKRCGDGGRMIAR
jgi:hypothetical protein